MSEFTGETSGSSGNVLVEEELCAYVDTFRSGQAQLNTTLFHDGAAVENYIQKGTLVGTAVDAGPYPPGAPLIRGLQVTESTLTRNGLEQNQDNNVWSFPNKATVTTSDQNHATVIWEKGASDVPEVRCVLTLHRPI